MTGILCTHTHKYTTDIERRQARAETPTLDIVDGRIGARRGFRLDELVGGDRGEPRARQIVGQTGDADEEEEEQEDQVEHQERVQGQQLHRAAASLTIALARPTMISFLLVAPAAVRALFGLVLGCELQFTDEIRAAAGGSLLVDRCPARTLVMARSALCRHVGAPNHVRLGSRGEQVFLFSAIKSCFCSESPPAIIISIGFFIFIIDCEL